MAYQANQVDQWYHRYDYDADNRLTLAETSSDSVIWDKDAEYKYYKHGPLARTLLGEHAVQGVDYVYTIHGWLKGVNSNTLVSGRDVGQDGSGSLALLTARDAYGFTLGYYCDNTATSSVFEGDYRSIGTTSFEAKTAGSPLASGGANLYNGNISHMVSAVNVLFSANSSSPLATSYHYDQLNRIKSVQTYNGINSGSNLWNSGSLQTAYKETFKYDANGNITKLTRNNKTTNIDNLTYNYTANSNQLAYVDDAVSSGTETGDIDDESSGNYTYDKIGNLVYDRAEEIDSIKWTVYGKISEIIRKSGSTRPNLSFKYDAMGQRVLKIVKRSPIENDWDYTWYVRDAQGNVMATYTKKSILYNDGDSSIYRLINNSLIDQMNSDSLASLIKKYFSGSQFETDLATVINDRGYVDEFTDLYEGDSLLTYEDDFAQTVLEKFCDYYSSSTDRNNMRSLLLTNRKSELLDMIDPACTGLDVTDWMVAVLSNDNTSNTFLTALNSLDAMRFDMVYQACGGLPSPPFPPATLAAKIAQIRSNPDAVAANNIKNFFGPSDIEPIIQGLGSTLQDNAINSLDFCNLMSSLSGSCYGSTWFDFVYDYVDEDIVKNIIINESDGFYLADLLLTNDRRSLNKVAANFPDLISDVLRNTEDLDFSTYLFYIYKKFGRTVFNQVLDDVGTITLQKTLTLDELHIYGSSRHGIKKPKTRLVAKIYELDEIESDGEFTYGSGTDSVFAKINYHYFKRTLTYKQYELTNHLGNVLATIMDRKTPQISSGNVSYYEADVSTAQYYYAFGSAIKELSYAYSSGGDTSKYRYGCSGQERDGEIGDYYSFENRIYDSRLGRWLSLDIESKRFPEISAYSYSYNNPIYCIDMDGDIPYPHGRLLDRKQPHKKYEYQKVVINGVTVYQSRVHYYNVNFVPNDPNQVWHDITINQYHLGLKWAYVGAGIPQKKTSTISFSGTTLNGAGPSSVEKDVERGMRIFNIDLNYYTDIHPDNIIIEYYDPVTSSWIKVYETGMVATGKGSFVTKTTFTTTSDVTKIRVRVENAGGSDASVWSYKLTINASTPTESAYNDPWVDDWSNDFEKDPLEIPRTPTKNNPSSETDGAPDHQNSTVTTTPTDPALLKSTGLKERGKDDDE